MEITRIRALRGPNLWSRHTAIEAVVTCDAAERDLHQQPTFEQRLRELFPHVGTLQVNQPAAPSTPLSMAHALELVTLALQAQAGCPVTFSRTTPTEIEGTYQVAVQYTEEAVGRLAFDKAQLLCRAAAEGGQFDVVAALAELRELDEDERLGPSTGAIVDAAVRRGIPFKRLTRGSLVQLGWGSRQRRIQAAEVDGTSAIAESIAQDKDLTKKLLHAAGVPVPLGRPVGDLQDAWAAAQEIGLPVVVKPQDGNQGKGVTVGILDREHFDIAYQAAAQYGTVMVERFLPGHDFRLLVVGNQLVAAARREPPLVVGDGEHTVRELVAEVNKDPRRGEGHGTSLTRIRIDAIAEARLAAQGLTPDSVPTKGQRVVMRNNANLSTGGTATDVTDSVHPLVAARAIEAAQTVGLDICGVDVVCETVIKPLEEQNGGIVEVNAAPGLRMHLSPSYGKGRDVGQAVIDHMFPDGGNGRIPVIAVTGTNGKTTTTAMTGALCRAAGKATAVAGNISPAALSALMDSLDAGRLPEVWVLELSSFQLETTVSLEADAAAVLNVSDDHMDRYAGLDDYAAAKARIFEGGGVQVLNRQDPRVMAMARAVSPRLTFGLDAPAGADDFGIIDGWLAQGAERLLRADELAVSGLHNAANALAALALCRAIGLAPAPLLPALREFRGLPHRVERIAEIDGAVWYDDSKGTNVGATVAALEGLGRKVVLIAGGDGKGQDFAPLGPVLAAHGRALVLIGRDAMKIEAAVGDCGIPVIHAQDMDQAVRKAAVAARGGDAVLLSPACASFDMYRNYVHRAEVFVQAVNGLAALRREAS